VMRHSKHGKFFYVNIAPLRHVMCLV
jgi:hypothetical protein